MAMYEYSKDINPDQLAREIRQSSIITALDYIETQDLVVKIHMKAELSVQDEATLDDLVDDHIKGQTLPTAVVKTKQELLQTNPKYSCLSGTTDSSGYLELLYKIPGTFDGLNGYPETGEPSSGRYIYFAEAKFLSPTLGDMVTDMVAIDHDNILGAGVDTVLGGYIDQEVDSQNRGIYLNDSLWTRISVTQGPRFIPSGMYIRIKFQKATAVSDTVFINFFWNEDD